MARWGHLPGGVVLECLDAILESNPDGLILFEALFVSTRGYILRVTGGWSLGYLLLLDGLPESGVEVFLCCFLKQCGRVVSNVGGDRIIGSDFCTILGGQELLKAFEPILVS